MNLFYHPECGQNKEFLFDEGEAMHLAKVLRKKSGDMIDMTDGVGVFAQVMLRMEGKKVFGQPQSRQIADQQPVSLELAVGLTKNQDRLEWFVEKAVEIGVGKIVLLETDHTERGHVRKDRLERVAISAMKQSLKAWLPEILGPIPFQTWAEQANAVAKCIAHCKEDLSRALLVNAIKDKGTACIAIGPEGDFSLDEIKCAESKGFISVSMGEARLRTETAAMCAVHTFELARQISL